MVPGLMAIAILMAGVQGVLHAAGAGPLGHPRGGRAPARADRACSACRPGASSRARSTRPPRASWPGPAMILLMHGVGLGDVRPTWSLLLPLVAICGLLSAAFGLTLGTDVQPRFAGLLFAVVLGPMMLFGCAYYPWAQLSAIGPVPVPVPAEPAHVHERGDAPRRDARGAAHAAAAAPRRLLLLPRSLRWLGARTFEKRTIL